MEIREGDRFTFRFYFGEPTTLQKVNISADTINSYPDRRVLSFPFRSLEINNERNPVKSRSIK
jgi:hypothetical protein